MIKYRILDAVVADIESRNISLAVYNIALTAVTKMRDNNMYWKRIRIKYSTGDSFRLDYAIKDGFNWDKTDERFGFWDDIDTAPKAGTGKTKETNPKDAIGIKIEGGENRVFSTGATRDTATDKPDYEGYLSPLVIQRFGQYMLKHQKQSDGTLRDSDNWQKGIPKNVYMKSAFRHFIDMWKEHRGIATPDGVEDNLCALIFNISGYLHEYLKSKKDNK